MAVQVNGVIYSLHKLTILSIYIGIISLRFNSSTNQFEKCCSKCISTIKFVCSLIPSMLYFVYANHFVNVRPSQLFILIIGELVYLHMIVFLMFGIVIANKRHEDVTMVLLNKLHKFQINFKRRKPLREIVVLSVLFGEAVFRFAAILLYSFHHYDVIWEKDTVFMVLEVISVLVSSYSVIVRILSEARLYLTYIVIAQHCDFLSRALDKDVDKTVRDYQILLEVAKDANSVFSGMFLMYIAVAFVAVLMRAMSIYCSIIDKEEKIMNNVEVVSLVFIIFKLASIIVIPSGAIIKV
jgi:hypothetical protein